MKKGLLLVLVSVFGVALLTGCGKSHTLKCEQEKDGQKVSVEVTYNDDETKPEKVEMEMVLSQEDATKEELEAAKDLFKQSFCSGDDYDKCDASVKGNSIVVTVSGTAEKAEFPEGSLEDAKKQLLDEGYTCK